MSVITHSSLFDTRGWNERAGDGSELRCEELEPLIDQIFAGVSQDDHQAMPPKMEPRGLGGADSTSAQQEGRAAPRSPKVSRSRAYVQELSNPVHDSNQTSDKFTADRGADWFNELLRRQLNFAMTELRACQYKCRWLELKISARDDQLKFMPDLLSKSLMAAAFEAENIELKRENEMLRQSLERMHHDRKQNSFSRHFLDRFFGAA